MLKRFMTIMVACAVIAGFSSCMTHTHVVGMGAQGNTVVEETEMFFIAGLIGGGSVDTNAMAGGASDYTIQTQTTVMNGLIASITGNIVVPRTVTVTK